ncbi:FAD-dependent oxidoreductase [Streptomyces sp. TLI_105]|uniref:FAD-dependent oxidoreductase n=1 Tax=Streptomyces sp. TLI_105 TaxID=1881019 RepID=UPI000897A7A7|nr:FAD-dependent oxidoreductase [Streptomyces sp. TLI_105]SEE21002.1 Pyridine nucleotide-disulphide oxidoreductase [Streptomyces sp. TLI_105]
MSAHNTLHKVVVIGGGYAGTLAANRLRARDDADITLVNPRPEFVERIRLHQFAARTGDATIDYGALLGKGVELVADSAAYIGTTARTVRLASGRALDYDYVIYAVGSTGATPASVPGAVEHAVPIAELESAQRLRARLDELPLDAPVTVVGGGLTGIVTAGDAAAPSGQPLRMSGCAAGPLGAQAADTVLSRIAGTGPAVIDLAFTGACVSLGRRAGLRQFARKDDTAVNLYIGGRMGAAIKEVTCKFVVAKRIRREADRPGSMGWPKGGPRPAGAISSAGTASSAGTTSSAGEVTSP